MKPINPTCETSYNSIKIEEHACTIVYLEAIFDINKHLFYSNSEPVDRTSIIALKEKWSFYSSYKNNAF